MNQISSPSPNSDIASDTSVVEGQKILPARDADASLTTTCVTNLVFDEPGTGDEFGPHQRIADAIAAVIDEGDKSVALGVEGAWGSGKTTVVNLLRNSLNHREQDYALITFDAWAHEGDPLRRTFLESVIEQLNEKQRGHEKDARWIDPDLWKTKLDEVAKRRTVEENKNVPKLGKWDKALVVSLLFVPIGNALLGSALREGVTLRWGGEPAWKFLWQFPPGLLFILAPLAVILWRRYWKGEKWDDLNIWTLLTSKGVSESRTETYKTPEPTSLEFEKSFLELTKEALKNPKRKIILVIDNLDRVDSDDALTIWSTLQTFFQHKPSEKYGWLSRLWTVVLYDPRGLSALWSSAGDGASAPTSSVYKSFVDKTFQVRFEVPAPVLSEWRDFLMQKLQDAFPSHSEDWHTVYRVRALHSTTRRPTARELKLFVNQIGALHRQWARGALREQDEYPLPHIACYVILREAYEDLLPYLLNGSLPHQNDKNLLGPDISRSLAGLAFNIERDRGYQMLLDGPIRSALIDGRSNDIRGWAEKSDGFWEVLEGVVSSDWFGDEPLLIANAAKTLEESGVLSTTDRREVRTVEDALCGSAERIKLWSYDETGRAQGLATLCRWSARRKNEGEAERFAKTIVKAMTGWLLQDSHTRSVDTAKWLKVARLIADEVSPSEALPLYDEGIVAPIGDLFKYPTRLTPSQIGYSLEVLFELANHGDPIPSAAEKLQSLASSAEFLAYLEKSPDRGDFTRALCLLTVLVYRPGGMGGLKDEDVVGETSVRDVLADPPTGLISRFTDLLAQHRRLGLLLDMLDNMPFAEQFVMSSLRYIAKDKIEYTESLFTPEEFIERYSDLRHRVDTHKTEHELMPILTARMLETTPLIKYISDSNFNVKSVELYATVYSASENEALKAWCYRGLKSVNEGQWKLSLRAESGWFELILGLGAPTEGEALGHEFSHALLKCGKEIIEGTLDPESPLLWQSLPMALGAAERDQLRTGLLNALIEAGGSVPDKFIEAFGEEMADQVLLNSQPRIFSDVFVPIVEVKSLRAIKWLTRILPLLDAHKVALGDLQALATLQSKINSLTSDVMTPGHTADDNAAVSSLKEAWSNFLNAANSLPGVLIQQ